MYAQFCINSYSHYSHRQSLANLQPPLAELCAILDYYTIGAIYDVERVISDVINNHIRHNYCNSAMQIFDNHTHFMIVSTVIKFVVIYYY